MHTHIYICISLVKNKTPSSQCLKHCALTLSPSSLALLQEMEAAEQSLVLKAFRRAEGRGQEAALMFLLRGQGRLRGPGAAAEPGCCSSRAAATRLGA